METRANYVLIGAFTLAGILGAMGLLLWLAKVQVDRQFAYYEVLFDDVSGLGNAGDVRYNGIQVGQVTLIRLDEADPSKVRVTLEVDAATPIKTDTTATLELQGVTGVSYVALSGGSPEAPRLDQNGVITAERSAIQSIFQGAPELLERAIALLEDVNSVVDEDNRAAIDDVLTNLASASGRLDRTLADFEALSGDLGDASRAVAGFTERLDGLADTAEVTLETATTTLSTATGAITRAEGTIDAATEALNTAETTFATADDLMQGELRELIVQGASTAARLETTLDTLEPAAQATLEAAQTLADTRIPAVLDQVQTTAATLDAQVASVGTDASSAIKRYEELAAAFEQRVRQVENTFFEIEQAVEAATVTVESIGQTSDSIRGFVETDGRPLVTEATATLASVRRFSDERLPLLADQVEASLRSLDALDAQASAALVEATARLREAQGTLQRLDGTLEQASATMASVERTSDTVNALVEGDGAALVADARAAAAEARDAIATINATVQEDLPGLMEDVRGATQTANRVIDQVGTDVSSVAARLDGLSDEAGVAIRSATETFAIANTTLESVTAAMATAEGTLGAAETTFDSVNRIIDEDFDAIVLDVRRAVEAFTTTIEGASSNIDAISDEVLAASRNAAELTGNLNAVVAENRRQVSDFLRVGLPAFIRFTDEARRLIVNLERLANRVERDPARFLLGTQASEFSR